MSFIPEDQSPAEYIGKIIGIAIAHIASSYWFLFTINVMFNTKYPYDFTHVFSSYFIVMNLYSLVKNK
jgi:hypothetical protein